MTAPLWTPSAERIAGAQITRFVDHVNTHCDAGVTGDYFALHQWAVNHSEDFWSAQPKARQCWRTQTNSPVRGGSPGRG
jgi:hypothetical protein